jgi:hypothetical protein
MPSLMPLAQDVGFTGFRLCVEGIEGLFQPLLEGFAGIKR